MRNIDFIPHTEYFEKTFLPPEPSYKNIPDWFKKTPLYINGKKNPLNYNGTTNLTVKWCTPLLDSYTSGYQFVLAADIFCNTDPEYENRIQWQLDYKHLIESHSLLQIDKIPIEENYDNGLYKFSTGWGIKTPKGYSCLITHPLNRMDLPFYSLSAVVDTDSYNIPVNIPFLLKNNYNGIIKRGTPIAQIIPFKRENWKSSIKKYVGDKINYNEIIYSKLQRFYKDIHWKRKRYE